MQKLQYEWSDNDVTNSSQKDKKENHEDWKICERILFP